MAGGGGGWRWGWLAGWVVGKSDFNENPVVSLDLDLDFGLQLRVCQKEIPFSDQENILYDLSKVCSGRLDL